jgi:glutamate carboxypeptidase
MALALSMAKTDADLEEGVARMLGLEPQDAEVKLEVKRGVTRPVWSEQPGDRAMFETARELAKPLGIDLTAEPSGGGSDGNFTGALGIPTLDGLGVEGRDLHTLQEHIFTPSLVPRARLLAGLLHALH